MSFFAVMAPGCAVYSRHATVGFGPVRRRKRHGHDSTHWKFSSTNVSKPLTERKFVSFGVVCGLCLQGASYFFRDEPELVRKIITVSRPQRDKMTDTACILRNKLLNTACWLEGCLYSMVVGKAPISSEEVVSISNRSHSSEIAYWHSVGQVRDGMDRAK